MSVGCYGGENGGLYQYGTRGRRSVDLFLLGQPRIFFEHIDVKKTRLAGVMGTICKECW